MFTVVNDYVLVKQDVVKVSEVVSAGEVKKNSGKVVHYNKEMYENDFENSRVFFTPGAGFKMEVDGEELLAVRCEDLVGIEFEE